MIEGIIITPLKQFHNEAGKVMHMLRSDSTLFNGFGEIYFSCANPGCIKAWRKHLTMTSNYAVVHGSIKCVIYDDRENSGTQGDVATYILSPDNYKLLTIPPLVWTGFQEIANQVSIVANCTDLPHDPEEVLHRSIEDPSIPFAW